MQRKKTVLLIDDHALFREGLKKIIESDPEFEVIGEEGKGSDRLRAAGSLKPDLIIVDVSLPDTSGIKLIEEILQLAPETKILILSMHNQAYYIIKAFQAGASGYVVKESSHNKLLEGFRAVLRGEFYIDSSISNEVIKGLTEGTKQEMKMTNPEYNSLGIREQEVMRLLAEGATVKEIADQLFISPKTVDNHRSHIMRKLDLKNTVELVRYAARIGLIDVDLWKG